MEDYIMKAIMFTEYGSPDVLQIKEVAKPSPKDNEILIRVHATPVNYGDLTARNFANSQFNMPAPLYLPARMAFGWNKPKINILGSELAGKVEAVGKDVTKFKVGDQVFAYLGMNMGANAEYVCVPESATVVLKPANLSYEEASTLPYGAVMATSLLAKANTLTSVRGQKVLINGASGGIGSMAVQLAKHFGAEVTGVCSTPRLEFVKSLGADKVIDYTKEDFTQNGETYDLIFDILGRSSFSKLKRSLKPHGIYLLASYKMNALLQMLWTSITGSRQKVICAFANETAESLVLVKGLVETGKIKTVIDKCFPLEQASEAHRYVEEGHKQGNVVITICR
jgi:NADPH:quinone reductase-like Zn-dependent oxidoreductase